MSWLVQFIANFMTVDEDPRSWAKQREAQGWPILGCADHLSSTSRAWPHVWVTLAAFAQATTTALVTSSFVNNLLRSPVEVAQAALQLQRIADGRFELGLGAGWSVEDTQAAGLEFPSAGERAGRYGEAFRIVKQLVTTGSCDFSGAWYNVRVPALGPLGPAEQRVPMVASLGGARTIREVGPLADRIELKSISTATRGGTLDIAAMRDVGEREIADLVATAREANPTAPLGIFALCSAGADHRTLAVREALAGTFMAQFFGEAAAVAEALRSLERFGLERVQVSPLNQDGWTELGTALFG